MSTGADAAVYDLIVLGAGVAGQQIAHGAAATGMQVAIVEDRAYGGTCPLRGCDPKLVYTERARVLREALSMQATGIHGADGLVYDWHAAREHKRSIARPIPDQAEDKLRQAGISTYHGRPVFTESQCVRVGQDQHLRGRRFAICVGARPSPLGIPGEDLTITSDQLLDLDGLPGSAVCIGGGYVGMESASILAAAGCPVTVIAPHERPLSEFDPVLVDRLCTALGQAGVNLRTGNRAVAVHSRSEGSGASAVELEDGSQVEADCIIHAAGRVGNADRIGAERANIAINEDGRVLVDDQLRVQGRQEDCWAAGDCTHAPRPPLTPTASCEANTVLEQLQAGTGTCPPWEAIPTVTFTWPPIARIGPQISDLVGRPGIEIVELDLAETSHFRRIGESAAMVRLAIDRDADRLRAAHLLGPHMDEVINLCALLIQADLPLAQVRSMVAAYPSVGYQLASWVA